MQRTQIENVIPKLSSNRKCKLYILVGNNPTANETCRKILENTTLNPTILFAFQVSGGRREGGRVISIHLGRVSFHIGASDGDTSYSPIIDNIFASSCFNVKHSPNMDSWLKCHAALILPIAYLTYWANGDLKKASKNKEMLNLAIDAIAEGYEVIRACDYPIEPKEDEDYIKNKRKRLYWILKIMAATPIGRLAGSDHAMSAVGEMRFLSHEFDRLKKSASLSTPNWDRLEQYLAKE
jgi:2-dehydropantoate 2-reductase